MIWLLPFVFGIGMLVAAYSRWEWTGLSVRVIATAGDQVTAEYEIVNRWGKVVGLWAYGSYHPDYPYQGNP